MKTINLEQLQKELISKNIPAISERLKKETGYDALARKKRRNPDELKLSNEKR